MIFEERGFGIGADNASPVQYASLADGEDEPGSAGVTLTSGPSAARPTSVDPAPSQRADLPADVTAILNGGTAPTAGRRNPTTSRPAATPARPAPTPPRRPAGRWIVPVGSFRDREIATDWLTEVNRRFRSTFAGAERVVQDGEGRFRSRFTGMTEDAARAACEALEARHLDCLVIRPD